ncbi:MAG: hypothetical protein V4659_13145 [Pseudomonadota bacterium]
MTFTEILVTAFVIILVLVAMWRVGQLNPVGTGGLARRINQVELRVGEIDARLSGVEDSVVSLADSAAKTATEVAAMRLELAADRGVTERTWEAVNRLQLFFMDEGLKRMTDR